MIILLINLINLKCCYNITKIPIIKGLLQLDCSNTKITETPNIEGLQNFHIIVDF